MIASFSFQVNIKFSFQNNQFTKLNKFNIKHNCLWFCELITRKKKMSLMEEEHFHALQNTAQRTSLRQKRKTSFYNAILDKKTLIKGILLMLLSAFMFSLLVTLVKYGSDYGYSSSELLMICGLFQFIITSILICNKRRKHNKQDKKRAKSMINDDNNPTINLNVSDLNTLNTHNQRERMGSIAELWQTKSKLLWLIMRGITGASAGILYFEAVTLVPIGNAIAIFSLYPVTTVFFAYIFLKEKIGRIHCIALIVAIGGGLLVSQPGFIFNNNNNSKSDSKNNYNSMGYLCSLTAAIFAGLSFIAIRKLKNFDSSYVVLSYAVGCTIFGLVFAYILAPKGIRFPADNNLKKYLLEWLLLFSAGIVAYLANLTQVISAQLLQSGLSSLLRSTDTIYSYIFQIVLFSQLPDWLTVVGAILIMSSVALVSFAKYKQSRDKEKKEKEQFMLQG